MYLFYTLASPPLRPHLLQKMRHLHHHHHAAASSIFKCKWADLFRYSYCHYNSNNFRCGVCICFMLFSPTSESKEKE
ncbi:hypothetical protein Q3G72_009620 [Acer saccharum]|nr:hypothetical protein Q3G72_009620 [Acer saccharum]